MNPQTDQHAAFSAAAAKYFALKAQGLNRTPEGLAAFEAMVDAAPQDLFDSMLDRAADAGLIPQGVANASTAMAISAAAIQQAKGGAA
jgi:hypothetical protein